MVNRNKIKEFERDKLASNSFKQKMRDNRMWTSLAAFVLGAFFLFLTICGDPGFGVWNVGFMKGFAGLVDVWNYWIFIVSVITFLFGAGYFIDFHRKRKELKELLDTNSKKAFINSQEDIESLAWKLGSPYEKKVDEKMEMLHIRR